MKIFRKAWTFFRPYRKVILFCYMLSIVIIGLNMVNPYLTKILFDRVYEKGQGDLLLPLLLGMIGVTVLRHGVDFTKNYLLEKNAVSAVSQMRESLLKKFFTMSYETFNTAKTGDLLTLLTADAENIKKVFASTFPAIFECIFSLVVASAVLFSLHPLMAFCTYLTLPLIVIATKSYAKHLHPVYVDIREQTSRLSTVAQENLNGVRIVRAFAREEYEKEKFDRENLGFTTQHFRLVRLWMKHYWKLQVMGVFPYVMTLLLGGILVILDKITLGTFVAFSSYVTYLITWAFVSVK